MRNVIKVKNLTKKYGQLRAVNNISFEVRKGEVFGLLGENGAGKTTTLEIIEGLRPATSGRVDILGHNIKKGLEDIKERIGVQLQSSAYFNDLSLREILHLFGSFYSHYLDPDELLEIVELEDKKNSYIASLSGGQKQRFSIVASLINDPEIIFLDEPTTGLDPLARRNLWEIIFKIKKQKKTIILTTHYMEEADILCDRVAIMEAGKILTLGEVHKLVEHLPNPYKITFIATKINQKLIAEISKYSQIRNANHKINNFEVKCKSQESLNRVLGLVQKLNPKSLTVSRATLEDVFIELTGKTIKDEDV